MSMTTFSTMTSQLVTFPLTEFISTWCCLRLPHNMQKVAMMCVGPPRLINWHSRLMEHQWKLLFEALSHHPSLHFHRHWLQCSIRHAHWHSTHSYFVALATSMQNMGKNEVHAGMCMHVCRCTCAHVRMGCDQWPFSKPSWVIWLCVA